MAELFGDVCEEQVLAIGHALAAKRVVEAGLDCRLGEVHKARRRQSSIKAKS